MTRDQYNQMIAAARAAIESPSGVPVLTLEWSRAVVEINSAIFVPPMRPSFQQDAIRKALEAAPPTGLQSDALRIASGATNKNCSVVLCYMVRAKKIAMLKIPGRSRYFADQAALQQGAALVAAEERAMQAEKLAKKARQKALVIPQFVQKAKGEGKVAGAKKTPQKADHLPMAKTAWNGALRKKAPALTRAQMPAVIPDGLVVQQCPSSHDTRFSVEGPIVGGFVTEWETLRGGKK